jgi:lipoprotein-anchoring transpeptidase ErfK/SrfK
MATVQGKRPRIPRARLVCLRSSAVLGSKFQRLASLSAAVLVGLGALAACGGGGDEEADKDNNEESSDNAPMERGDNDNSSSTTVAPVATANGAEVAVYPAPDAAEPLETFPNPYKEETAMVFLVEGTDVSGEWLPVYVPIKPNGSKGFVRAADVSVTPNPYWVRIEQSAHRIVVTNGDEVLIDDKVGLGEAQKDTPNGVYFIRELIENIGDPVYGPYAYGLSAFTENEDVAERFGGVGQVGLHGTNDPSSIGQNVSNGCIRVNNDIITELAGILPLGTPVEIVA